MKDFNMGDLIAALPGTWSAWQEYKRGKSSASDASFGSFLAERLPNPLGIGHVDEGIYGVHWVKLKPEQKAAIRLLYDEMETYEVDALRQVICFMPRPIDSEILTAGSPPKREITYGPDPKQAFLEELANEVITRKDAKAVAEDLRANRFIVKDPAAHKLYLAWLGLTQWMEKVIRQVFGVDRLDQITPRHFAVLVLRFTKQHLPAKPADWSPSAFKVLTGQTNSVIAPKGTRIALVVLWILAIAVIAIFTAVYFRK